MMSLTDGGGSRRRDGGPPNDGDDDDDSFKLYLEDLRRERGQAFVEQFVAEERRKKNQEAVGRLRGRSNKLISLLRESRSAWSLPAPAPDPYAAYGRKTRKWLNESRIGANEILENLTHDYGRATYVERQLGREEDMSVRKFVTNPRQVLKVDDRMSALPGSHLSTVPTRKKKVQVSNVVKEENQDEGFGSSKILRQLAMNVARQTRAEAELKNVKEPMELKDAIAKYDAWMAERVRAGKV